VRSVCGGVPGGLYAYACVCVCKWEVRRVDMYTCTLVCGLCRSVLLPDVENKKGGVGNENGNNKAAHGCLSGSRCEVTSTRVGVDFTIRGCKADTNTGEFVEAEQINRKRLGKAGGVGGREVTGSGWGSNGDDDGMYLGGWLK
jgi:hypothetical protein